jgi:hypothetical protein
MPAEKSTTGEIRQRNLNRHAEGLTGVAASIKVCVTEGNGEWMWWFYSQNEAEVLWL